MSPAASARPCRAIVRHRIQPSSAAAPSRTTPREVSGSASRTNTSYRRINDSEHADRAAAAKTPGTKQRRIREYILRRAPVTFRLADIRTAVPGVSDQTIRIVLEQLKNEGKVRADGTDRAATWTRMPNTHIPNKRSAPANLSYWDYEGALLVVR
jgi:hypothetical protein